MNAAKTLVVIGALLIGVGALWAGLSRLPGFERLGRLPGDIHIERDDFSFHFPWVTCLLLSLVLSAALRLWSKLR